MAKLPQRPNIDQLLSLTPALIKVPAKTRLWRIYFRGGAHPTRWSSFRYVGPTGNRFDHHQRGKGGTLQEQDRAVLYAAESALTCIAEVFQQRRVINWWRNEPWLVAFELNRPLRLLDLTGHFPTQAGASMALMTRPRAFARQWAHGFHQCYPEIQGLYYPSSMHANQPALVLNERAAQANVLASVPKFHRALGDLVLITVLRNAAVTLSYSLPSVHTGFLR